MVLKSFPRHVLFLALVLLMIPLGGQSLYRSANTSVWLAGATSKQAPYLRIKDRDGNQLELSALKGKVVFINFWATWCPPCLQEIPSIRRLQNKYKDNQDIVFLLIDIDGNLKFSQAFLRLRGIKLPVYAMDSEIPAEFLPGGIPTSLLIDRANYVAGRQVGGANYMDPAILNRIEQLLAEDL